MIQNTNHIIVISSTLSPVEISLQKLSNRPEVQEPDLANTSINSKTETTKATESEVLNLTNQSVPERKSGEDTPQHKRL